MTTIFVAYIGWQQWRTSRDKLRLDLYNKRFDVYSKTISFYQALCDYRAAEVDGRLASSHIDFIKVKLESQFLFRPDSKIMETLYTLHSEAFNIIGCMDIGGELLNAGLHNEFMIMHNDKNQAFPVFDKAITDLAEKVAPYLNFHETLT